MVKKKILVTGANGLLGQKIIYNLKNRTDVSLLACSKGVNRLIETNGYKYIELDITNKNQVQNSILRTRNFKNQVQIGKGSVC